MSVARAAPRLDLMRKQKELASGCVMYSRLRLATGVVRPVATERVDQPLL